MPTRLTLASNGCDRETGRGQEHVESKALRDRNRCRSAKGQGKTCMVNATLRESQTRNLISVEAHQRLTRLRRVECENQSSSCSRERCGRPLQAFDPVTRATLHRRAKGRTGHLSTSNLRNDVNAGSPKRAGFTSPARRRSHHISQMPGVMPGTAAHGRTAMRETALVTGLGSASRRVKGDASAEVNNFMTMRGYAPRRR